MTIDIILDLFVITCLVMTIIFAVRLNKKLSTIHKSRDELQTFLNQFSASMEKADAGIKDLRGIGESVFKTAQDQLATAEALKSDLSFLNERGEDIAQKLDTSIRDARKYITHFDEQNQSKALFPDINDLQDPPLQQKEPLHYPSQNFGNDDRPNQKPANQSHATEKRQPSSDTVPHLKNIR